MGKKIAVIGSGLAGTAAALACGPGSGLTIISAGGGATSFCSGALDVAGDVNAPDNRPDLVGTDVAANIRSLISSRPRHAYALLAGGSEAGAAEVLELVKQSVAELFPSDGLVDLEGDAGHNRPCFTSLGTVKFTALYPTRTARPDSPAMERPLVVGIIRLLDFDPETWGLVAAENSSRLGRELAPLACSIRLGPDQDRQAPETATLIGRDMEAFAKAVRDALGRAADATCVVLPPVLPVRQRREALAVLDSELSLPVYETLSLPPSVPGIRISAQLADRARERGVMTVRAMAVGFETDGKSVKSVVVDAAGEISRIEADAFVLATGKFVGGGIIKDPSFRETVFDLPVFSQGEVVTDVHAGKVLGCHVNERHDLFEAGLETDNRMRPLGADGSPAFDNLFAAGSVLAGHNYIVDGAGAGAALATGARAGKEAGGD